MSDERRYGCWSGDPKGVKENPERCRAELWPTGRSMITYQFTRKRGHGPDGAFCSQHARSTKHIKPIRD